MKHILYSNRNMVHFIDFVVCASAVQGFVNSKCYFSTKILTIDLLIWTLQLYVHEMKSVKINTLIYATKDIWQKSSLNKITPAQVKVYHSIVHGNCSSVLQNISFWSFIVIFVHMLRQTLGPILSLVSSIASMIKSVVNLSVIGLQSWVCFNYLQFCDTIINVTNIFFRCYVAAV